MSENFSTNLIEIFSSVQGEGKYVGCRQVFVRLADCNLSCAYCDTDFKRTKFCSVETSAGSMNFQAVENPISAAQAANFVKKLLADVPTHSVSFTGGEPLLHGDFIRAVAEPVKNFGAKIFLETNGTLHNELEKILDVADIISMDIKMPGIVGENLFDKHRKFIEVARGKDFYVKVVISSETSEEEFDAAVNLVAETAPNALLILQPVTPTKNVKAAPAAKILSLQARALAKIKNVRVIPQTHKIIHLL